MTKWSSDFFRWGAFFRCLPTEFAYLAGLAIAFFVLFVFPFNEELSGKNLFRFGGVFVGFLIGMVLLRIFRRLRRGVCGPGACSNESEKLSGYLPQYLCYFCDVSVRFPSRTDRHQTARASSDVSNHSRWRRLNSTSPREVFSSSS